MSDYEADINELGDDDRQADVLDKFVEDDDEELSDYDDDDDEEEEDGEEEIEILDELPQVQFKEKIVVIAPEERRTDNFLSDFEMTEITSIRATQIAQHNNCQVDITGMTDPLKMAWKELMLRRCPLKKRRQIGEVIDGDTRIIYVEDWDVNVMGFAHTVEV